MFLKEDRRKKLIATLMLPPLGCPRDIAEKVSDIPDGMHDQHAWAHAQVMANNAHPDGDGLYIGLSAAVLQAIYEEAIERNMTKDQFIMTERFMQQFCKMAEAERTEKTVSSIDLTKFTIN